MPDQTPPELIREGWERISACFPPNAAREFVESMRRAYWAGCMYTFRLIDEALTNAEASVEGAEKFATFMESLSDEMNIYAVAYLSGTASRVDGSVKVN